MMMVPVGTRTRKRYITNIRNRTCGGHHAVTGVRSRYIPESSYSNPVNTGAQNGDVALTGTLKTPVHNL